MPLIANAACDTDLSVRITGGGGDLTLIYSHITQMTASGDSQANQQPIPASTSITDHMLHNPVKLTISGNIGCMGCMGCTEAAYSADIVNTLETARLKAVYTPADFFTIVTNRMNRYTKMILISYKVEVRDNELQTLAITTNWQASNIAGSMASPSIAYGGVAP